MTRAQLQAVALGGASLLAGVLLGWSQAPRIRAHEPLPEPAGASTEHPSPRGAAPADLEGLRREVAALEQELEQKNSQSVAESDRLKGLLARIPGLKAAADTNGLLALMQELAALGEPGYPGAVEIGEILAADESSLLEISDDLEMRKILTPAMLELAAWILRHPKGISGPLAELAFDALDECGECDLVGPLLDYISTSEAQDLGIAAWLRLEDLAVPSMAPKIAASIQAQAKNAELTWRLSGLLARLGTPGSLRELEALAASQDPNVSASARDALAVLHPPPGREAVTATGKRWDSKRPLGVQWGDVVVSYEGTTLTSLDQLASLYAASPQKVVQVLTVERRGRLRKVKLTFDGGNVTMQEEYP
jgi:hypothetical protein